MKGRPKGTKNTVLHMWTDEEKEYLGEITPGHHYKEIQELMAKRFNIDFTLDQVKGIIARCKFKTGFTGCFYKNHIPFNKGKDGREYLNEKALEGIKKTQFKKGQAPINWREIGSERITVDGYIEVKVAEPNKWRLKQQLIYENNNGKIPKGYVVIFGDADKNNFNVNNLILVSRKQLLTLNRNKLITNNADLTRTGIIIANVYNKIGDIKRNI